MNKYQNLELIGEGGDTVAVYKAYDKNNDRIVAIKQYKTSKETVIPIAALREISVLRKNSILPTKLKNIIRLIEIVYDTGDLYLVMEYFGITILNAVSEGMILDDNDIERAIVELVETINFLHTIGYIHGDLNLKNVLFDNLTKSIRLIDFCSAIRIHRTNIIYNPMIYVCPYEIINNKSIDVNQLDIWMLGCILYYLINKNPLFLSWDYETHVNSINEMLGNKEDHDSVGKPLDIIKNTSQEFIKKMMSINPFKRAMIGEVVMNYSNLYAKFKIKPCLENNKDHIRYCNPIQNNCFKFKAYDRLLSIKNLVIGYAWENNVVVQEIFFICFKNILRINDLLDEYSKEYLESVFYLVIELFTRAPGDKYKYSDEQMIKILNVLEWDIDPYTMYDYIRYVPKNIQQRYVFLIFLLILDPIFDNVLDIEKINVVVMILGVMFDSMRGYSEEFSNGDAVTDKAIDETGSETAEYPKLNSKLMVDIIVYYKHCQNDCSIRLINLEDIFDGKIIEWFDNINWDIIFDRVSRRTAIFAR